MIRIDCPSETFRVLCGAGGGGAGGGGLTECRPGPSELSPVLVGLLNSQCRQGPAWGDPPCALCTWSGRHKSAAGRRLVLTREGSTAHQPYGASLASLLCRKTRSAGLPCVQAVLGCCPLPAPIHTSQTRRTGCRAPLSSGGVGSSTSSQSSLQQLGNAWWAGPWGPPGPGHSLACSYDLPLVSTAAAPATQAARRFFWGGARGQRCYPTATRQGTLQVPRPQRGRGIRAEVERSKSGRLLCRGRWRQGRPAPADFGPVGCGQGCGRSDKVGETQEATKAASARSF